MILVYPTSRAHDLSRAAAGRQTCEDSLPTETCMTSSTFQPSQLSRSQLSSSIVESRHQFHRTATTVDPVLVATDHTHPLRTDMSHHTLNTPRRVDDIFSPVASSSRAISTALARIPFPSPYLPSSSGGTSAQSAQVGTPEHPAHYTTAHNDYRLQTPRSRSAPSPIARFRHRRPLPPVSPRSPIDQEPDSPECARVDRGKMEEPVVLKSGEGTRVYVGRALFERHW
jgi:hypothetical protein